MRFPGLAQQPPLSPWAPLRRMHSCHSSPIMVGGFCYIWLNWPNSFLSLSFLGVCDRNPLVSAPLTPCDPPRPLVGTCSALFLYSSPMSETSGPQEPRFLFPLCFFFFWNMLSFSGSGYMWSTEDRAGIRDGDHWCVCVVPPWDTPRAI